MAPQKIAISAKGNQLCQARARSELSPTDWPSLRCLPFLQRNRALTAVSPPLPPLPQVAAASSDLPVDPLLCANPPERPNYTNRHRLAAPARAPRQHSQGTENDTNGARGRCERAPAPRGAGPQCVPTATRRGARGSPGPRAGPGRFPEPLPIGTDRPVSVESWVAPRARVRARYSLLPMQGITCEDRSGLRERFHSTAFDRPRHRGQPAAAPMPFRARGCLCALVSEC